MRTKRTGERAAVQVARKLAATIRGARLRPGTKLPAEHRMVEDFGVARATVREALRFLELQGALRIKAGPGGGPVVSVPGAEHLASVLSLHLQFTDASFRTVLRARRSIYPVLAAEAAEGASREDLTALQASISRMDAALGDSRAWRAEARRFMTILAAASGNPVLALVVDALHRMSDAVETEFDEKRRRSATRGYERAVRAIDGGDGAGARSIMEELGTSAARYLERTASEQLEQPVAWLEPDS